MGEYGKHWSLVKLTIFKWLVATAFVATSASTAQAACRQALAMGLDVSGSVDAEEYQLQLKGLATALTSPDVTSSILTMPKFPLWPTQRHDAPATAALGKAILAEVRYLNQKPRCWKRTLDISGDGKGNTGPPPHTVNLPEKIGDVVINALVIGIDATKRLSHEELSVDELATYFSNRVLAGPGAFVEIAVSFDDYEQAMILKLLRELEFSSLSRLSQ